MAPDPFPLQCIIAENQALLFSLHSTSNSKAFNATMTKQESAVLFLESLLLGSLLWLIGIVCQLVVLPSLHQRSQLAIQHLSAAGFGPKLLGVFKNGMVQSFIDARTLTSSNMSKPKLEAEIAKQLKSFHQVEVPGSKEPQLWDDIFKFFKMASSLTFDDHEKQKKYVQISFEEVRDEITKIKFMKEVVKHGVRPLENETIGGDSNEYTDADIDDIREEWAIYVSNFIFR